MPFFRKKPVVIEALQFTGANHQEIVTFIDDEEYCAVIEGDIWLYTLEGDLVVVPNDWVIRGIAGEIYPCKPDIFEQTYDPVE